MNMAQNKCDEIFFCGYDNSNCSQLCDIFQQSFSDNQQAVLAVEKILKPLGLPRNFVIIACPDINNAVAYTPKDQANIRYIVYDNKFMESIDNETTTWSSLSILAHEVGHHLCGHTLSKSSSLEQQREKEIQADYFSGFIMYKLGASLEQSQSAVRLKCNNNDDTWSTHPKLDKRLKAIEDGYKQSKSLQTNTNFVTSPGPENYYNEGNKLLNYNNYSEAIDKFTTAINLNPKFASAYNNRGIIKYKNKDFVGAINDYNSAILIDDKLYEFYYNRGLAKDEISDFTGAIQDYDIAIKLNINASEVYNCRGLDKILLNDKVGACLDFKTSCDLGNINGCDNYNVCK